MISFVCSLSARDGSGGVDMEILKEIFVLMEDIHEWNPSKCTTEQQSALKVLVLNMDSRAIIVGEYCRLFQKYGNNGHDAKCAVLSGILQFVDSDKVGVDEEAVNAICDLLDVVHDENPSLLSKEQKKSIKKLMLKKDSELVIVREYKRLIRNHGLDAHRRIMEGLLEFVE